MHKIGFITVLTLICLKSINTFSQNQKENHSTINKELQLDNALVNNGKPFNDNEVSTEKEHRYFLENKLYTEEIKYDNQVYLNSKLKYDIYKDEIILNPDLQPSKTLYIINKEKVDYFTIQNRKFVKIKLVKNKPEEYIEESINTKQFTLYIKYIKINKGITLEKKSIKTYISETKYFIKIGNDIHEVKSKKSILKLYPQLKSEIDDFYRFTGDLEKENNVMFMENLMLTVKKFLNK